MNLIVDIGNTRIKTGLFLERELKETCHYPDKASFLKALPALVPKVTQVIVCSVINDISDLIAALPPHSMLFESHTPLPVRNAYQTQATLGSDRLAAAIGAWSLYPGKTCLSIDAGTCIKYNLITTESEYLGGAISPGLAMRLKAMHHYTDRLPLIAFDDTFDTLLGRSTQESLLSGALTGASAEADGMIARYAEQYPGLITVITGGDGPYLAKRLKSHIFAEPNLVLKGLNEILIYNLGSEN